jgi:Ca2+-binding EF-hand superfamily protein
MFIQHAKFQNMNEYDFETKLFYSMNLSNTGFISYKELKQVFEFYKLEVSLHQIAYLTSFDPKGLKLIHFMAFILAVNLMISKPYQQTLFNTFFLDSESKLLPIPIHHNRSNLTRNNRYRQQQS